MSDKICANCGQPASKYNTHCVNCNGIMFLDTPRPPADGPRLPARPITGLLRLIALVLLAGVLYATMLSYQNAPGDTNDKLVSAAVTFGVLGLATQLLVRALQAVTSLAVFVAVVLGLDHFANDGQIRAFLAVNGWPAVERAIGWVEYLVFGPS